MTTITPTDLTRSHMPRHDPGMCDYPTGDRHPLGDQPQQVWAHQYGSSAYCGPIRLCLECYTEGWGPDDAGDPADCYSAECREARGVPDTDY